MKFALLLYGDESAWVDMPPEEAAEAMKAYEEYDRVLRAANAYGGGEGLEPTPSATTVRLRDGETVLTDGPFAETREQLGGFYIVDCKDLDEALRLAAQAPDVAAGGAVEVRPIIDYEAYGFAPPEQQGTRV